MADRYIWCQDCGEVHHVSLFDGAPVYMSQDGEITEVLTDDRRAFFQRHAGHGLKALKGVGGGHSTKGRPLDPMRLGYIQVTDGDQQFVLRSWRTNIEEPLRFDIQQGRLRTVGPEVSVEEKMIRKEMKRHFKWGPSEQPDDQKIELFIHLFTEEAHRLDPRQLEVVGFSNAEASVVYASMGERGLDKLMKRCAPLFLPEELRGLKRFCKDQMAGDGVMTIRLEYEYAIEQEAQ